MANNTFKVLYTFRAEGPAEMSVTAGDVVGVVGEELNGWVKVKLGARTGFVPRSYIVELVAAPQPAPVRPPRASPPPPAASVQAAASNDEEGPSVIVTPPLHASAPPLASQGSVHTVSRSAPEPVLAPEPLCVELAECAVCYDSLHSRPVTCMLGANGSRSCTHYIHLQCMQNWQRHSHSSTCPACRAPFATLLPVPNFETDPAGFFKAVDANGNGSLSRGEVINIAKALLPVDQTALEADVENWWFKWDKSRVGELSFEDLLGANGLFAYLKMRFELAKKPEPPAFTRATREAWFKYWDDGNGAGSNGSLEQEELVRALIKTLKLSTDTSKVQDTRAAVREMWGVFQADGSPSITYRDFVKPDGLADSIEATLAFSGAR